MGVIRSLRSGLILAHFENSLRRVNQFEGGTLDLGNLGRVLGEI